MKTPLLLIAALALLNVEAGAATGRPRVVATTTIVGDVVQAIGGPDIDLTTLLRPGLDPHTFEPAPRDAAAVAGADLLFINGGGLETFLEPLVSANRQGKTPVVDLCEGLTLTECTDEHHGEPGHEHHAHGAEDPHVWLDPQRVIQWTRTIERALAGRDPEHAAAYQQRAEAYRAELAWLDQWVLDQVAGLPEGQRHFVTDHDEFGYFAERYGFTITGALLPNVTTSAETSAREMATLEDRIRATGTRVLVIGAGVNPSLASRVAHDTGLQLVTLWTGSLSDPSGPAATYLAYMRHNVTTLLNALKADRP